MGIIQPKKKKKKGKDNNIAIGLFEERIFSNVDAWKVQLFDGQNLVKVVGVVLGRGMWDVAQLESRMG